MFKKAKTIYRLLPLFLLGAVILAACAPATPAVDSAATSDAMHAAETQAAGEEAMHMAETQAAEEEAMHAAETQAAEEEAMHMAETQAAEQAELTLSFNDLEDLGEGFAYEGWIIVDGAPVSTGTFTVDGNGVPSATTFALEPEDLSSAAAFVLTVEPVPDDDPAPSAIKVLGGEFAGDSADLTAAFPDALGDDFSGASGGYVLAVPSAGTSGAYTSGIWWLEVVGGSPMPVLELPELPAGWVYEGWVVGPDGPISTGRFTSASGADSDGAGPTSGPGEFPPFPGQDFVNPELNLIGYMAVISIEPEVDNSPAPFFFKPLVDMSIEDVGAETLQPMENNADTFPSGTASR